MQSFSHLNLTFQGGKTDRLPELKWEFRRLTSGVNPFKINVSGLGDFNKKAIYLRVKKVGLAHKDGALLLQRTIFKQYYRTLLSANIEYGGSFGGQFDPGDGRYCYLRLERAMFFPTVCFHEREMALPAPSWFRRHATRGTWHLHCSANLKFEHKFTGKR